MTMLLIVRSLAQRLREALGISGPCRSSSTRQTRDEPDPVSRG
jgi:hypothetical protein